MFRQAPRPLLLMAIQGSRSSVMKAALVKRPHRLVLKSSGLPCRGTLHPEPQMRWRTLTRCPPNQQQLRNREADNRAGLKQRVGWHVCRPVRLVECDDFDRLWFRVARVFWRGVGVLLAWFTASMLCAVTTRQGRRGRESGVLVTDFVILTSCGGHRSLQLAAIKYVGGIIVTLIKGEGVCQCFGQGERHPRCRAATEPQPLTI